MNKILLLFVFLFSLSFAANQFTVNLSNRLPWDHYWEECVGSGHAALSLRENWRDQMRQTHRELGFRSVRFHGIFDDEMSVLLQSPLENSNNITYSWFNVDNVYDFLLSIGMKPYVELSFMPIVIASGTNTTFHYDANITPPKKWQDWYDLVVEYERHIVERYGLDEVSTWNQECWNEYNCGFWTGDFASYLELFSVTSAALKSVSNRLRIGGPVTCGSANISEFIDYCKYSNVKYDFIATHEYPTDPNIPLQTGNLQIITQKIRDIVGNGTYLSYSEYNDGLFYYPSYHDTPYAAAFIIQNAALMSGILDVFSWWTFSDIFEEQGQYSQPFFRNQGWGLLNIYGIPKPSYRAFQLLHNTGNTRYQVVDGSGNAATLFALATNGNSPNTYHFFVTNYNIPNRTISNQSFNLVINDPTRILPANLKASITRIDEDNSYAPGQWLKMGQPMYPNNKQIQQLKAFSELSSQPISFSYQSNTLTFNNVTIPTQAVLLITVEAQ